MIVSGVSPRERAASPRSPGEASSRCREVVPFAAGRSVPPHRRGEPRRLSSRSSSRASCRPTPPATFISRRRRVPFTASMRQTERSSCSARTAGVPPARSPRTDSAGSAGSPSTRTEPYSWRRRIESGESRREARSVLSPGSDTRASPETTVTRSSRIFPARAGPSRTDTARSISSTRATTGSGESIDPGRSPRSRATASAFRRARGRRCVNPSEPRRG